MLWLVGVKAVPPVLGMLIIRFLLVWLEMSRIMCYELGHEGHGAS